MVLQLRRAQSSDANEGALSVLPRHASCDAVGAARPAHHSREVGSLDVQGQRRPITQKTLRHVLEALRDAATKPCRRSNCGSVCLCMRCHARAALAELDPNWRP